MLVEARGGGCERVVCTDVVVCLGPWCSLAQAWFSLPAITAGRAHSITVVPHREVPAQAIFLEYEDSIEWAPEIYPRPDGEVCGLSLWCETFAWWIGGRLCWKRSSQGRWPHFVRDRCMPVGVSFTTNPFQKIQPVFPSRQRHAVRSMKILAATLLASRGQP